MKTVSIKPAEVKKDWWIIDAEGLVSIVRVWQEMSACGKSLVLLDPSPAVGPLLSMTGLPATYTDH